MNPLWTSADLVDATGGQLQGNWSGVTGIAIDNREMDPGDLFIALEGISHDGHVYVAKALEAGATAAMVSHIPDDVPDGAPLILVDDTLKALERLGAAGRARTQAKVIAVTGSVGKTSTKDMLRTMLAGQGSTHAPVRSFNNHWGVPLTLARMPPATEFAVIEIGMNHPGEITPLSRLTRPDVALITTVEAVHLAAFESVEQIADAKAEIFAGLPDGGIAVLNADNPHFERLSSAAAPHLVQSFGRVGEHTRLHDASPAEGATVVRAAIGDKELSFTIGAPGTHFALNAVGALTAIAGIGADPAQAAEALAHWSPPDGRGKQIRIDLAKGGQITLLDESYNANPASVRAALAVLGATATQGRRVAYLGDMLELGPSEQALHAALADLPETQSIHRINTCGSLMQALHAALPEEKRGLHCADSQELAGAIALTVDAGDVCMVKGSLGARMARVVTALRDLGQVSGDAAPGEEVS
jgi:UDP-N-acetylmuramoyl-tripeptide--D-alanyl-D-alanine ligase